MKWSCEPQLKQPQITVGEIYQVVCQGEPVTWTQPHLQVIVPPEWKYHFQVLQFDEVKNDRVQFSAVTYKTGEYQLTDQIFISDGTHQVHLLPWKLQVSSVIQAQPGMEPQPFGPFGPFELEWPIWIWATLVLLVFSLLMSLGVGIWHWQRKRQWAYWVSEYSTPLTPYQQFYKDFRRLSRLSAPKSEDFAELEKCFRLYFLRELGVPTLREPAAWVLKWLRKKNRQLTYEICSDLERVYRELERAKNLSSSPKDFEQLYRQCQHLVDRVYQGLQEKNL